MVGTGEALKVADKSGDCAGYTVPSFGNYSPGTNPAPWYTVRPDAGAIAAFCSPNLASTSGMFGGKQPIIWGLNHSGEYYFKAIDENLAAKLKPATPDPLSPPNLELNSIIDIQNLGIDVPNNLTSVYLLNTGDIK